MQTTAPEPKLGDQRAAIGVSGVTAVLKETITDQRRTRNRLRAVEDEIETHLQKSPSGVFSIGTLRNRLS